MPKPSRILANMHEAAKDLHEAGMLDTLTMRRFDALCLPPVRTYDAAEIRAIREHAKVSQSVFAAILNVGPATVASWERNREHGGKQPSGPALKLLELVDRKGIQALA
jgi:putative transcriptional regulator